MCPECGRTMAQGHAEGCSNGPQIGSRTIPFGSPPRDIIPEGTRVSRNRYERVQRFPGPNWTVVENPQASVDGATWIDEPWEAMQSFRPSGGVIRGRPIPPEESPRTSADMPSDRPRESHTVTSYTRGGFGNAGLRYRCTCGWEVDEGYLMGLSERDVRGMIEAHCAGGQVGPQKQKARADVACYNCGGGYVKPVSPRVANMCCDGELIVKPRRHFKLEMDS